MWLKIFFEETKRISLNDYDTNTLIKAGLLHDIGKVYRSFKSYREIYSSYFKFYY